MEVSAVSDTVMSSGAIAANFIFSCIFKSKLNARSKSAQHIGTGKHNNKGKTAQPRVAVPRRRPLQKHGKSNGKKRRQKQRQQEKGKDNATLRCEAVERLEHFVGGAYDAGIRFVGALREDHVDEFGDDIDVGLLDITLLNRAKAFGSSGRADNRIARSSRGREKILADAIEPAGILKRGELKRANLSGLLLAWLGDADGPVVADRERIGRNRDAGLDLITVLRDEVADVVEGEISGARIRDFAAWQEHLEEAGTLDREVEWVAGRVEIALPLDHLRGGGASAQTDLQAGRNDRLLSIGRAGRDHTLVEQVFKLKATAAKAGGVGVGEIVGNVIETQFLRFHAARGGVKRAKHYSGLRGFRLLMRQTSKKEEGSFASLRMTEFSFAGMSGVADER